MEVPSNGGRNLVPTGTGRRPTGSDRNIPAATRSPARSTLMPRRVTELIKENNELGNYNAASGNNSMHGHSSSQPTRLNATHQESRGMSNSQPAGSITECLSPLKTRSQGLTNFRNFKEQTFIGFPCRLQLYSGYPFLYNFCKYICVYKVHLVHSSVLYC